MKEERNGIDDLIDDLDRIPKEIESSLIIEDIADALLEKLRRKISI